MLNPPIRALLFDLDGVLTDTAEYHYRAWKRLADEEGIPFSREDNDALRGVSRQESLHRLLRGRPIDEATAQEWMARKDRYYREFLEALGPGDLLPGVVELLEELQAAGLQAAVVSASRNAAEVLERLGLGHRFRVQVTGRDPARPKPAPDLFLLAARRLGISPAECIGIEDAAAGIRAIHRAGMVAVGVGPPERVGDAELVVPDLAHVCLADLLYAATLRVRESAFQPDHQHHRETVFTLGNGMLGTRGTLEERFPGDRQATLIHGMWDDTPIVHTELVNCPDWTAVDLWVDGHRFRMDRGTVEEYSRYLDLRRGELHRHLRWTPPDGAPVRLHFVRLASLADPHLAAVRVTVTPLERPVSVRLRPRLDGHVANEDRLHLSPVRQHHPAAHRALLQATTRHTDKQVAEAMVLRVDPAAEQTIQPADCPGSPGVEVQAVLQPGVDWSVEKLVAIYTSEEPGDPAQRALDRLDELEALGFEQVAEANREAWDRFWDDSDIILQGDHRAQLALRHGLFQLRIAAPSHDGRYSIPAKTLSGFGYRGHVFWDTEIFVLPFFIFTQPRLARNLLLYRWRTLEGARRNARAGGHPGARYAWESAETGDEVTPRWVPDAQGQDLIRIWCGDIELHITADVAFAIWQYWKVTGDDTFMRDHGAQILLETARFWEARVEPDTPEPGQYSISDVIGPDEYHEHVTNNAYTNRLVAWHLRRAVEAFHWLEAHAPEKARELQERLELTPQRLTHWRHIADHLVFLQDPETGLIEQFQGFFQRKEVDWEQFRDRETSMQALLGIQGANEHQVLKQPDVILLMTLLEEEFDAQAWAANWAYYVPRTDHSYGSSLGPAIHAWAACILGRPQEAYEHFLRAARADLEDIRGNADEGIHAASAGGLWQAVVFGFAGLRVRDDGEYTLKPCLPDPWERLAFRFYLRGRRHQVELLQKADGRVEEPWTDEEERALGEPR